MEKQKSRMIKGASKAPTTTTKEKVASLLEKPDGQKKTTLTQTRSDQGPAKAAFVTAQSDIKLISELHLCAENIIQLNANSYSMDKENAQVFSERLSSATSPDDLVSFTRDRVQQKIDLARGVHHTKVQINHLLETEKKENDPLSQLQLELNKAVEERNRYKDPFTLSEEEKIKHNLVNMPIGKKRHFIAKQESLYYERARLAADRVSELQKEVDLKKVEASVVRESVFRHCSPEQKVVLQDVMSRPQLGDIEQGQQEVHSMMIGEIKMAELIVAKIDALDEENINLEELGSPSTNENERFNLLIQKRKQIMSKTTLCTRALILLVKDIKGHNIEHPKIDIPIPPSLKEWLDDDNLEDAFSSEFDDELNTTKSGSQELVGDIIPPADVSPEKPELVASGDETSTGESLSSVSGEPAVETVTSEKEAELKEDTTKGTPPHAGQSTDLLPQPTPPPSLTPAPVVEYAVAERICRKFWEDLNIDLYWSDMVERIEKSKDESTGYVAENMHDDVLATATKVSNSHYVALEDFMSSDYVPARVSFLKYHLRGKSRFDESRCKALASLLEEDLVNQFKKINEDVEELIKLTETLGEERCRDRWHNHIIANVDFVRALREKIQDEDHLHRMLNYCIANDSAVGDTIHPSMQHCWEEYRLFQVSLKMIDYSSIGEGHNKEEFGRKIMNRINCADSWQTAVGKLSANILGEIEENIAYFLSDRKKEGDVPKGGAGQPSSSAKVTEIPDTLAQPVVDASVQKGLATHFLYPPGDVEEEFAVCSKFLANVVYDACLAHSFATKVDYMDSVGTFGKDDREEILKGTVSNIKLVKEEQAKDVEAYKQCRKKLSDFHFKNRHDDTCLSGNQLKVILPPSVASHFRKSMSDMQALCGHGSAEEINDYDMDQLGYFGATVAQKRTIEQTFTKAEKRKVIESMWEKHFDQLRNAATQLVHYVAYDVRQVRDLEPNSYDKLMFLKKDTIDEYLINYDAHSASLDELKKAQKTSNVDKATVHASALNVSVQLEALLTTSAHLLGQLMQDMEHNYRTIVHSDIIARPRTPFRGTSPGPTPGMVGPGQIHLQTPPTSMPGVDDHHDDLLHVQLDVPTERSNLVPPTEKNLASMRPVDVYDMLRKYDEDKALPIAKEDLHLPEDGDFFLYRGSRKPGDWNLLMHNDSYAWKNSGRCVSSKNKMDHHTIQKTRVSVDKYEECSNKWKRTVYYLSERDLYAIHYSGDNTGVLKRNELKSSIRGEMKVMRQRSQQERRAAMETLRNEAHPETSGTLAENFARILGGTVKEQRRREPKEHSRVNPVESSDPAQQLSEDQIADMLAANVISKEKGELPHANKSFIVLPQGGDIFALQMSKEKSASDRKRNPMTVLAEINSDGYRWGKKNTSYNTFSDGAVEYNCVVVRHYCHGERGYNARFKRYTYYDPEHDTVLIHYLGDHTVAVMKPHGNTKPTTEEAGGSRIYYPTNPRVKQHYRDVADGGKKKQPTAVFADLTKNVPGDGESREIHGPRNARQAAFYAKKFEHQAMLKGQSELEKIAKVGDHLQKQNITFVRSFQAAPHKTVVLFTDAAVREFYNSCRRRPHNKRTITHYDTTYGLAAWYASVYCYRSETLESRRLQAGTQDTSAILPLAVFLHEKRDLISHEQFFHNLTVFLDRMAPTGHGNESFSAMQKVLVTDREFRTTEIANTDKVYCWNHLRKNVDFKLTSERIADVPDDSNELKHDFEELLRSSTLDTYRVRRDRCLASALWQRNPAWSNYFTNHIAGAIEDNSGRWNLDRLGLVYDPRTGVTNNPAETMNSCIKVHMEKEQLPMHKGILSFKSVLDYYDSQAEAAYYRQGVFKVKAEHHTMEKPRNNYRGPPLMTADQLYDSVKKTFTAYTDDEGGHESPVELPAQGGSSDSDDEPVSVEARFILSQRLKPSLDPQTGCFVVTGSNGDQHAVKIQPNKYCSCQSPSLCAHVLACMVMVGERPNCHLLPGDMNKSRRVRVARRRGKPGGKAPLSGEHHHAGVGGKRKTGMRYQRRVPRSSSVGSSTEETTDSILSLFVNRKRRTPAEKQQRKVKMQKLGTIVEEAENDSGTMTPATDNLPRMQSLSPGGASYHSQVSGVGQTLSDIGDALPPPSNLSQRSVSASSRADAGVMSDIGAAAKEKLDSKSIEPLEDVTLLDIGETSSEKLRSGQCYQIVCSAPGFATIVKHRDTLLDNDAFRTAAVAVSRTTQRNPHTGSVNIYVAVSNTQSEDLTALTRLTAKRTKTLKPKRVFVLDCRCRQPVSAEDKDALEGMMKCNGACKRLFHKHCFTEGSKDESKFVCGVCQINTPGMVWSENFPHGTGPCNTCCIDNCLNALVLHCEINPKLPQLLHEAYFKSEGIPIMEMLQLCRDKKFGDAQAAWYNHMLSVGEEIRYTGKPNDLYGGEDESLMRYLTCASKFTDIYTCKDPVCGTQIPVPRPEFELTTRGRDVDYQLAIPESLYPTGTPPSCTKCGKDAAYTGLDPGTPPSYFLQIHTSMANPDMNTFTKEVPLVIDVSNFTYHLKYVLLHIPDKGHFTSAVYHNGEWYHFDDMQKVNRISYPLPSDFEDCIVEKVTYFLDDSDLADHLK